MSDQGEPPEQPQDQQQQLKKDSSEFFAEQLVEMLERLVTEAESCRSELELDSLLRSPSLAVLEDVERASFQPLRHMLISLATRSVAAHLATLRRRVWMSRFPGLLLLASLVISIVAVASLWLPAGDGLMGTMGAGGSLNLCLEVMPGDEDFCYEDWDYPELLTRLSHRVNELAARMRDDPQQPVDVALLGQAVVDLRGQIVLLKEDVQAAQGRQDAHLRDLQSKLDTAVLTITGLAFGLVVAILALITQLFLQTRYANRKQPDPRIITPP